MSAAPAQSLNSGVTAAKRWQAGLVNAADSGTGPMDVTLALASSPSGLLGKLGTTGASTPIPLSATVRSGQGVDSEHGRVTAWGWNGICVLALVELDCEVDDDIYAGGPDG